MANTQDQVVIIGAGIVGCSIALALSKRGYQTLNVDKLPAAGYGSTSHSSAIVRPIYSHPTSVALAHECRSYWRRWSEFIGPNEDGHYAQYVECGGLVLIKDGDEALYQANIDALDSVGVTYEHLNANQIRDLYPGINLQSFGPPKRYSDPNFAEPTIGSIGSALLVKEAGYVSDPMLATRNLQFAASQLGARFRFGCEITQINEQRITLGNNEVVHAKIIINASGPHSTKVNRLAGVSLPIQTRPLRHEVAYVDARNQHFSQTSQFLVDLDSGIYQRPDGTDIVIGSADPDCDAEVEVDPDAYNTEFTDQWTTQALRAAQRFPDLAIANAARGTVGIYDVSDDWTPIYDRTDLPNYYVAIGTSGNQFKNGPLIGELMANIIEQGESHDTNPATIHLSNINREIDLGFYSRYRDVKDLSGVLA